MMTAFVWEFPLTIPRRILVCCGRVKQLDGERERQRDQATILLQISFLAELLTQLAERKTQNQLAINTSCGLMS